MSGGWTTEAACAGQSALFGVEARGRMHAAKAKAVCAVCPVTAVCLEAAMEEERSAEASQRAGVWGGLTPVDREALYRKRAGLRPREPAPPGRRDTARARARQEQEAGRG